MEINGTYSNLVKIIHKKPVVNIVLIGEKLKDFPLRSGIKQGVILPPLLDKIVLMVLAIAISWEKELQGIQIGIEEAKLPLFVGNKTVHRETLKKSVE